MQLLSAGADGLVKLWTIKSNECEATLDHHMDKIWALSVARDGSEMATGGADSTIHLWRDFTQDEERDAQRERDAKLLKEQELFNCLRNDKLLDAVQLAFELGHPNRLLQILHDLLHGPRHQDYPTLPDAPREKPDFARFEPEQIFSRVVASLSAEQLKTLLSWIVDWNTNAKHTAITQTLLSTILREVPPATLKQVDGMAKTLDALIAYSERHFARIDRMLQKSYIVDFSVVSMKNLLPLGADDDQTSGKRSRGEPQSDDSSTSSDDENESDSRTQQQQRKRKRTRSTKKVAA
ncbi:hypothetical protein PINS_up003777 [Pythium insidiosum]|nr:hypothetical protein PINS_up003777 [Pythium insidiosum]